MHDLISVAPFLPTLLVTPSPSILFKIQTLPQLHSASSPLLYFPPKHDPPQKQRFQWRRDQLMTSANTWLRVSTANIIAKWMNGFYLCCAYDQCCGKESIACPSAWVQSVRVDPRSPLIPKASLQPASLLDASGLLCEALQREGSPFLVFAPFPSLAPSRKAKLYYHGKCYWLYVVSVIYYNTAWRREKDASGEHSLTFASVLGLTAFQTPPSVSTLLSLFLFFTRYSYLSCYNPAAVYFSLLRSLVYSET